TRIVRPRLAARCASQAGRCGESFKLPPSLTTTALPRRGWRPWLPICRCGSGGLAAPALDLDPDAGPGLDVELLDHDADVDDTAMGQTEIGDRLGQGLYQIDMLARRQPLDAAQDLVIGEDIGDVVVAFRRLGLHAHADVDAHALRAQLLMGIDADA